MGLIDTKIQSKSSSFAFLIILHKIIRLFNIKYITTDFKAIDSQETIATVKDFFID
jgi:hypothetical protein